MAMLKAFRQFLAGIAVPEGEGSREVNDERLAAAALLVHMSGIDGEFSADESSKLLELLKERFSIGDADAGRLVADAREADLEAVDLYGFTSILKSKLDHDGRAKIVEMLWEMVFADGEVHEFEENLVWRVSELLGISSRDRVRLKQEARRQSGLGQA